MATHSTTCPLDCPDACGILCGKTAIYSECTTGRERLDTPLVRNAQG
jgi:hypothetical protein